MGMHLLAFPAEIFGREFWALFKIFRYLYPFEKIISSFSRGKMSLNRHLREVVRLIQPCPKTLSVLVLRWYDSDVYKSFFSAGIHIYGVFHFKMKNFYSSCHCVNNVRSKKENITSPSLLPEALLPKIE